MTTHCILGALSQRKASFHMLTLWTAVCLQETLGGETGGEASSQAFAYADIRCTASRIKLTLDDLA